MSQTTIILGAGASADFGLPLGRALYSTAQSKLQSFEASWDDFNRSPFGDWNQLRGKVQNDAVSLAIVNYLEGAGEETVKPAIDLLELMREIPAHTIDTLTVENTEHLGLCKTLVASILSENVSKSISRDRSGKERWLFGEGVIQSSTAPVERVDNWIHLFTAMMRHTLTSEPERKFKVISFNYDMIFERVLERIWSHPTRDLGEMEEIIEFVYPHGKISWMLGGNGSSRFEPLGKDIEFAHGKFDHSGFKTSKEFIRKSDRLISLGFHFASENMKSLDLPNAAEGLDLTYQNFEQSEGLKRRVSALNLKSSREFHGPIAEAIRQEIMGDMP